MPASPSGVVALFSCSYQNAVREKISLTTKGGNGNDRRNQLRAELDGLRGQQSNNKASRGKVLDQLKALQDGIQKKARPSP